MRRHLAAARTWLLAAGVVIGTRPLIEMVPLYRDPRTGDVIGFCTPDQVLAVAEGRVRGPSMAPIDDPPRDGTRARPRRMPVHRLVRDVQPAPAWQLGGPGLQPRERIRGVAEADLCGLHAAERPPGQRQLLRPREPAFG